MGSTIASSYGNLENSMKRILTGLIVILATGNAFGWSGPGHMTIADIAWNHLNPGAKAAVAKIFNCDPSQAKSEFIHAATWPDENRTKETAKWHYIDYYFRLDGKPTGLTPAPENVVWALNKFTPVLSDSSATPDQKLEALRYVEHFVGDITQPLHCASLVSDAHPDGDKGGNDFAIESESEAKAAGHRKPYNLHSLWDQVAGDFKFSKNWTDSDSDQWAKTIEENAKPISKTDSDDPKVWSLESKTIAMAFAYRTVEGETPKPEYFTELKLIAHQRLYVAGMRLARVLNKSFSN